MSFSLFDWISSSADTLLNGLREWVNEWDGSCDIREDNEKLGYYEELLQDLQQMEIEYESSIPSLPDKIHTLKLEVRYILPYMTCGVVTSDEAYRQTKRRVSIEGRPEGLIKFVEHMIEHTRLVKPDATNFYLSASIDECNWSKFTDCVLDNLKYVQSSDDCKDAAILIDQSLRFVRNFVMVVEKWNFGKLDNIEARIQDIYESMGSVSRDAALILPLFTAENFDGTKTEATNLRLSEVQEKINGVCLQAEEAYYDILALLELCSPDSCLVKSETLYGFIDSLQKNLEEVLTYIHLVRKSGEGEIEDMIKEMGFLKSVLNSSSDGLVGKLDDVATHVDVLACEAESAVYVSARELEEQIDHETQVKIMSLAAKINKTKFELRQTNRKDEMMAHCLIEDFLNGLHFSNRRNGPHKCKTCKHPVMLELQFRQAFLRCTKKWCIDHPELQAIRIHTEDVVRCAGWDIRSLSFKNKIVGDEVASEKLEFLLSDMVQKLTLYKPELEEICTKIRDSKPSSPCRLCKKFGLDFADVQCKFLRRMQTCELESIFQKETMVSDLAVFFRSLHRIAGNLFIESKRLFGLLTFLEDLIDRAACLSYLQLMEKADKTVSLKVLLDQIEEPEVKLGFRLLMECRVWNVQYSAIPPDVQMLVPVSFLIRFLEGVIRTDASVVISMKDHVETVLRDLILLKCILTDPLKQYFEQQDIDELLNDIGAGVVEAGLFFFFSRVNKSKVNIFFRVRDVVRCFSATVRQVYLKYTKLSPSKLLTSEMGSLNILLGNLKKLNKCRQIQELHKDLLVCDTFLTDTTSKQDELGMINGLRIQILSLGRKVANSLDMFDEVPDWFFKMRISDFKKEVKMIKDEIKDTGLTLLADVGSSNKMTPKGKAKPLKAQDEVIGFEDVEEELIKQLTTGSQFLEVISIFGMPGSGKTTLAMKVYETVAGSFHCSAWCYVSQIYQKKGLLQQIICEIEGPSEEIKELNDEDLAQRLYQCLMKKKDYLIILDDVWDIEAWNELRMCFPQGNYRNRILLTSRSKDVGLHAASSDDSCIGLDLLSTLKSRLLLEKNIFGARGFPEHLREIGTEIADKCGGLPLSLVLIAGVLKNKDENEEEWGQVAKNLDSLVQNQDGVSSKLDLSYKHLPNHLKQCFLYCGAFVSTPIRCGEIRRSKLVQLWVAERLIEETDEHHSLEEAAEGCLMDLISRSLLIVAKKGSDGRIRTCRIHDLLRDFCTWKGHQEQFLLTRFDVSKPFPNWHQRLCICLHMLCKVKHPVWSKPRIRSLIHSECDLVCMCINYGEISHILDKFRLLNVLDLESANMGDTFPESIIEMSLLRYLAVGSLMDCIPSSISKLSNLETLIVEGNRDGVRVPDTVFGLKKLRLLLVSPHTHFTSKSSSPDCLQLETLGTIIFCWCNACKHAIKKLPRLQKLKCILRGSTKYNGFPVLDSLSCLESIKASYSGFPPLCKFSFPILPISLKKITLSMFKLPWSEMENVAALPHVEYLKLHDGAFKGKKWETQYEFPSLKYLRLDSLDVEVWEASDDHFPFLERLIVRGCKHLKEIPSEFSDIGTLSCIEIDQCGRSVGDSAIKIEYEQRNYSGNKQFKAIISRIEEMVHIGEQANKEKLCSNFGILLAFQFVLALWFQNRSSH
ncbi:hypothetical protein RND81_14G077500 [Saponaria officinalis]|uniref:Late blight resistance protein homolog R1A-3 n=1 Tax=Saponaria officinalis TaxID=3572 RepID=A0AAW1GJP3_SAPOF